MTSIERYLLVVRPAEYERLEAIQPIKGKFSGSYKTPAAAFNKFVKLFKTAPLSSVDGRASPMAEAAKATLQQIKKFQASALTSNDVDFIAKLLPVVMRIESLVKDSSLDARLDVATRRVLSDLTYAVKEAPKAHAKNELLTRLQKVINEAYSFATPQNPNFLESSLGWVLKSQSEDNIALRAILAIKVDQLATAEVSQVVGRAVLLIKKGFRQNHVLMPERLERNLTELNHETSLLFDEALSLKQQYARNLHSALDMAYAHNAKSKFLEKSLGHWLHEIFSENKTLRNIQQLPLENLATNTLIQTAQTAIALIEKGFCQKDEPIPTSLSKMLNQLKSGF